MSRPGLVELVLVEPAAFVRVLDLDYQAERFALFHARWTTRWVHYLGTPVLLGSLLVLAAQASPVVLALATGSLLAWYLALHRLVGLAASLGVLGLAGAAFLLRTQVAPAVALATLAGSALVLNLSHAVEPVPPVLTGRGFEAFPVFWARASTGERLRLLVLNLLYAPLEVVSAPRLFPVHVLRALHALGWNRAWAESVRRRVAHASAS